MEEVKFPLNQVGLATLWNDNTYMTNANVHDTTHRDISDFTTDRSNDNDGDADNARDHTVIEERGQLNNTRKSLLAIRRMLTLISHTVPSPAADIDINNGSGLTDCIYASDSGGTFAISSPEDNNVTGHVDEEDAMAVDEPGQ